MTDNSWIGDCVRCGHNANDHDMRAYRLGHYRCKRKDCSCDMFKHEDDEE